jgi:hypothetical protein
MKAGDKDPRELVTARGSTPLDLHGIGPSGAARQQRHRLSLAGNRRINRTLHIMGVVQLRNPTAGRVYFDGKKAAGKTSMEAMRALKRRLSNVVYARMLADQKRREAAGPGGQSGTTLQSSATGLTPDTGPSDKPQPEPATTQPTPAGATLDIKGSHESLSRGQPDGCGVRHAACGVRRSASSPPPCLAPGDGRGGVIVLDVMMSAGRPRSVPGACEQGDPDADPDGTHAAALPLESGSWLESSTASSQRSWRHSSSRFSTEAAT